MKFPHLFSPIKIRGLELKNRIDFPGMGTFYTDDGGYVNEKFINYHAARALGGSGLITTEATSVYAPAAPRNFLNISDDKFIPGLKKFTDAIHAAGAKVCVQLWQGGITTVMFDPTTVPIAPSEIKVEYALGMQLPQPYTVPGASKETIRDIVFSFGSAAKRAVEAGFDTMEFHLAHGYSPHSFLSAAFNHRTDEYGGSFENRARYPLECIREIRRNIPEDMPLLMRIDAHDDYVENGLTLDDMIAFCKLAKAEGVDVVNVSRGNPITLAMKYEVPAIDLPMGYNVENAAAIHEATGLVTIAVGRINEPGQAEAILADGKADMVVIGRAQLADPEFSNKAAAGNDEDIIRCFGCGQGCGSSPMTCTRNPSVGREREFTLVSTDKPQKVAVIGGGMGGLEAAITLKKRGHEAILLEKSGRLGGQFYIAGLAPRKGEMKEAAISRGQQAVKAGVDIRLNTPATPEALDAIQPDAVVIATGAQPIHLNIPGANLPHVFGSFDVLEERVAPRGKVVVIGGGLVGLEAAEFVSAADPKSEVTVIEMLEEVGKDLPLSRKICVMEQLSQSDMRIVLNAKCVEITPQAVVVCKDGVNEEIPCDYVVMAVGSISNDITLLKDYCEERGTPYYVIGDAKRARKMIDAVAEAVEVAMAI